MNGRALFRFGLIGVVGFCALIAYFALSRGDLESAAPAGVANVNEPATQSIESPSKTGARASSAQAMPDQRIPSAPNGRQTPLTIRGENWARYPGTLGDQVKKALDSRDGEMARFLAKRLMDCLLHTKLPELIAKGNLGSASGLNSEDQVMNSLCQSVEGDLAATAERLVDLAISERVVGAAADKFSYAGDVSAAVVGQLKIDAEAGDLWSLITMASVTPATLRSSEEEQRVSRLALLIASKSASQGDGQRWIDAVNSISGKWGSNSGYWPVEGEVSEGSKARATMMANRLLERLPKKP